jgi:hypothetical protein
LTAGVIEWTITIDPGAAVQVAGFKLERWPGSSRNGWPASDWNARPASSEPALELLSRDLGVIAAERSDWRDAFLAGGEASLKCWPADARDAEIGRLKEKVGDLTMVTELLEAKIGRLETARPLARRRSRPTPRDGSRGDPGGNEPPGLALHG